MKHGHTVHHVGVKKWNPQHGRLQKRLSEGVRDCRGYYKAIFVVRKCQFFSYYILLNRLMQIRQLPPNKNWNATYQHVLIWRKTYRLMKKHSGVPLWILAKHYSILTGLIYEYSYSFFCQDTGSLAKKNCPIDKVILRLEKLKAFVYNIPHISW